MPDTADRDTQLGVGVQRGALYRIIRLDFSKGVDESQEASVLPVGFLTKCLNWVPEPTGGVRVRYGWKKADEGFNTGAGETPPTVFRSRSLFYTTVSEAVDSDNPRWWLNSLKNLQDTANNRAQVWGLKDDFDTGTRTWNRILRQDESAVDIDQNPFDFAKGASQVLITHHGMTKIKRWDGTLPASPANIDSTLDKEGRAIEFHKERFWMGGAKNTGSKVPHRLYFSNLNDGGEWGGASSGFIDVGHTDFEAIEDIKSFQGQLIIGKKSSVWILTGTPSGTGGTGTMNLIRLEGANCSPGRCLVDTPFGLVILGQDAAWLWKGGRPELISPAIQSSYALGRGRYRTGTYADGFLYVASPADDVPVLAFDMINGTWHTESVGSTAEGIACVAAHNNRLVTGPSAGTLSPMYYRDLPGSRVKDFNTLAPTFTLELPQFWLTPLGQPTVLHKMWVRCRQRDGSSSSPVITVTGATDEETLPTRTVAPRAGAPKVFVEKLDYGSKGRALSLKFEQVMTGTSGGLLDLEGVDLELEILPLR